MASMGSRHAWVRLTHTQMDAVLDLAREIDPTPESLRAFLPAVGQRAAFRGLVQALTKVRHGREAARS
jgi:hypothetical protein